MIRYLRSAAVLVALAVPAQAEEGFWTFDALPTAKILAEVGKAPSPEALTRLRAAAVSLGGDCSAVIAGANGLLVTNSHCVNGCVKSFSQPGRDTIATGIIARTPAQEQACPGLSAEAPAGDEDVSARMFAALNGLTGEAYNSALERETGALINECQSGDETKACHLVSYFDGAAYHLQSFRIYRDVRLVFAALLRLFARSFLFTFSLLSFALKNTGRGGAYIAECEAAGK